MQGKHPPCMEPGDCGSGGSPPSPSSMPSVPPSPHSMQSGHACQALLPARTACSLGRHAWQACTHPRRRWWSRGRRPLGAAAAAAGRPRPRTAGPGQSQPAPRRLQGGGGTSHSPTVDKPVVRGTFASYLGCKGGRTGASRPLLTPHPAPGLGPEVRLPRVRTPNWLPALHRCSTRARHGRGPARGGCPWPCPGGGTAHPRRGRARRPGPSQSWLA